MKRIALTIQYDGTDFSGWQTQDNAIGVQNLIEDALQKITTEKTPITGAGRTDKGVHALCQVAHFDTNHPIPGDKWHYHLNTKLPSSIRIISSEEVSPGFHARYSAHQKTYVYTVYRGAIRPPQYRNYTAHYEKLLDLERMQKGVEMLKGTHDFHAFMSTGSPVKNTIRTLDAITIEERGELLLLTFEAQSFLYNMVRILTGTLLEIGAGTRAIDSISKAFDTGERQYAGVTMPAAGLCLKSIAYPKENKQ